VAAPAGRPSLLLADLTGRVDGHATSAIREIRRIGGSSEIRKMLVELKGLHLAPSLQNPDVGPLIAPNRAIQRRCVCQGGGIYLMSHRIIRLASAIDVTYPMRTLAVHPRGSMASF
jgi:hypothetical protein